MAATPSSPTPTGFQAPAFSLPEPATGNTVTLESYAGTPVFVIFMCNHCPYVVHLLDALGNAANTLSEQGIQTIAISANDVGNYPADSPDKMAALAKRQGFSFPYLYDETQETAHAYAAECTPDLYLFDQNHKLYYRGQFDASRPGSGSASTGQDLLAAATAMMAGDAPPANTVPSVGCGIKWKATA